MGEVKKNEKKMGKPLKIKKMEDVRKLKERDTEENKK
jgi:hypothetical protein